MRSILLSVLCAAMASAQTNSQPTQKDVASISGRVVAASGQPLRKSTVTLRPMGMPNSSGAIQQPPQPYGTTTDAEGRFSFEGIEAGNYTPTAEHAGYVRGGYARNGGPNSGASNAFTLLNVRGGQQMTEVSITLQPQATIAGKVLDEDGEPAPRLQVRLLKSLYTGPGKRQHFPTGNVISSDDGSYKLTGLAPGRYFLSVSPPPNSMGLDGVRHAGTPATKPEEAPVTTYYPGTTDLQSAVVLDVKSGQEIGGIDVQLRKALVFHVRGKLSGVIPSDESQRLRVIAVPGGSAFFGFERGSSVAKDGSFDVGGLSPGTYGLNALLMQGQLRSLATRTVQISNENVEGVSLVGTPPLEVTGVVRVEGENETPRSPDGKQGQNATSRPTARVSLQPVDSMIIGSMANAAAMPDGSFVVHNVGPGRYRVNVLSPGGGYVKSIKLGGIDASESLDLTQGAGGSLEIVVSTKSAQLGGTVQDREGKPLSGPVTLIPEGPTSNRADFYRMTTVDESGRFQMRGLAPGAYRVYSWAELEQGAQYDPDFMKLHENEGQRVTLEEGGTQQVALVR